MTKLTIKKKAIKIICSAKSISDFRMKRENKKYNPNALKERSIEINTLYATD